MAAAWAAFVGTDAAAAIAGDVAMLASEVTPVLKALRQNGLSVVAIHRHVTDTSPTIFFLHYCDETHAGLPRTSRRDHPRGTHLDQ